MPGSLLLDEPTIPVLPSLAKAVGLNEAIVIQQLHFLAKSPRSGKVINGHKWIYNTYAEWREYFPWWSERTIERIFKELEEVKQFVVSCQPEGRVSRRKYYRLNKGIEVMLLRGAVEFTDADRLADSDNDKLAGSEGDKLASSFITETSTKTTTEKLPNSEHSAFVKLWMERFPDYAFSGKDGTHLKNLLKSSRKTAAELMDIARSAWKVTDPKRGWNCLNRSKTIPGLASSYNEIVRELGELRSNQRINTSCL